jgi:DNA modification methylase
MKAVGCWFGSVKYGDDTTEETRTKSGNTYMCDGGTRNKRSVWSVATTPYKGAHFAVFPEKLIEPCILAGCPEGGVVLDPFGGSGTTARVAIKNRRRAILIELNAEYIGLQSKRTSRVQMNLI